jgi:GntR family transcriptional regulator
LVIRINPQSAEPIFEQIIYQVKWAVALGKMGQGDRLPSVRELAKELAVNPNTVIRAYEALEREGVVVRRQGAGCFLTGKKSTLNLRERQRQMGELIKRTLTEAFHLGFKADEIRKALEKGLKTLRFKEEGRSS